MTTIADGCAVDQAEREGMSLSTYCEIRRRTARGDVLAANDMGNGHVPGDTSTAPAPGAIPIGPTDC